MKYNYLGKTELKVSELCLGTMTFGRETDEKTAIAMVDRFEEVGGILLIPLMHMAQNPDFPRRL